MSKYNMYLKGRPEWLHVSDAIFLGTIWSQFTSKKKNNTHYTLMTVKLQMNLSYNKNMVWKNIN